MLLARLHQALMTPTTRLSDRRVIFWCSFSLTISLLYSALALQIAFSDDYVVQDDARQYVLWMQRFLDPNLFPNDWIADYFQSVSPAGYVALYRGAIALGFDPWFFNKLLPSILGLITTGYCFGLSLQIMPLPMTAFISTLLLNQTIWMKDDLVSATPRAFVYPLFMAFLYYLSRYLAEREGGTRGRRKLAVSKAKRKPEGKRLERPSDGDGCPSQFVGVADRRDEMWGGGCAATPHFIPKFSNAQFWRWTVLTGGAIALLGLFYPQYLFVSAGVLVLSLVRLQSGRVQLTPYHPDYIVVGANLTLIMLLLAYFALQSSDFGPVITEAQARAMPEFWPPDGRSFFFSDNLWWFYGVGDRSGFLHVGLVRPATLVLGIFLPLLLLRPAQFPILRQITPNAGLLVRLLLSSTIMFALAHLLLFRLHLPARYTDHSLRIITAIAAALFLTALLDATMRTCWRSPLRSDPPSNLRPAHPVRAMGTWGLIAWITALLLLYPAFVRDFPLTKYKVGRAPDIYAFLRDQPLDTQIASVAEDVNDLPIFAQRSILVGREYAIPYHMGYYQLFRERAIALLQAQYTPDLAELQAFIRDYDINFLMVENNTFRPDYIANHWIQQYASEFADQIHSLKSGQTPALKTLIDECSTIKQHRLTLIDAACILDQ